MLLKWIWQQTRCPSFTISSLLKAADSRASQQLTSDDSARVPGVQPFRTISTKISRHRFFQAIPSAREEALISSTLYFCQDLVILIFKIKQSFTSPFSWKLKNRYHYCGRDAKRHFFKERYEWTKGDWECWRGFPVFTVLDHVRNLKVQQKLVGTADITHGRWVFPAPIRHRK